MTDNATIETRNPYGRFESREDSRQRLQDKAIHKALNIPMDDDVNINQQRSGLGVKELLAIGAMALGGVALYQLPTIMGLLRGNNTQASAPTAADHTVTLDLLHAADIEIIE